MPSQLNQVFMNLLINAAHAIEEHGQINIRTCLLYTSDAADERSSVDLGGRRIIKQKKPLNI